MILIAALLALALVALNVWDYYELRNGQWHPIPGSSKMRRFLRGNWQYREMSATEEEEAWY